MTLVRATVTFAVDGEPLGNPQSVEVDTNAPGVPRMQFLADLVDVGRAFLDEIPFELHQDDDAEEEPEPQGALP
jgi:hypothetical protein